MRHGGMRERPRASQRGIYPDARLVRLVSVERLTTPIYGKRDCRELVAARGMLNEGPALSKPGIFRDQATGDEAGDGMAVNVATVT